MDARIALPEGMPRPTGDGGQALLDKIWSHFRVFRLWPTFDQIDRGLAVDGLVFEEAVQQLCPALLRGVSSDITHLPQGAQELELTLAGAANTMADESVISVFLGMVRTAATIEPHYHPREPGQLPELLPSDLRSLDGIDGGLLTNEIMYAAASLGRHEPCFRGSSGFRHMEKAWMLHFDRGIRPFARVRSLDDYWRIRGRVVGPERAEAERRPFHQGPYPPQPTAVVVPTFVGMTQKTHAAARDSSEPMSVTCTLHPLIAQVAEERYRRGAYNDAVRSAFQAVEHRVSTLTGDNQVGERLMGAAFNNKPNPPKITATRSTGGSLESEQNGMQFLFKGAMLALRNPRSHGPDEKDDRDEADEMLAFASFLMRRLDIEDKRRRTSPSAAEMAKMAAEYGRKMNAARGDTAGP
ncbi:TIGR02391 family protein [Streptomyces sp. NPDC091217]|uniref:TIGR02391 family protein n=1 Tax=Streptomyces sp. NPDC091217 TaxID=3365975 RepID=UPI00380658A4